MLKDKPTHTSTKEIFDCSDIYGVSFDKKRACRKKVRLAIIGAGGIAQSKYLPAIMRLRTMWEPVEVVAVSRRDERQGKKIVKLYGCRWYANSEKMLREEDLDGVLVTGPDELHAEHVMMSLDANLHVLVGVTVT
ncbi:MAG: Gfo/Idh/MocA family oxidoreductase [Syntrophales bacterium]|nr:Gfo/Idh/MocA family oxidoreductase [Syntrophales bacterium]